MNRGTRRVVAPLVAAVVLVGAWEVGVRASGLPPFVLPAPSQVAATGVRVAPLLGRHIADDAAGGGARARARGRRRDAARRRSSRRSRSSPTPLYPLVTVTQTVPTVVLAPLLILWAGFGLLPKVLLVALTVFFPVLVSAVTAMSDVDGAHVDMVAGLGGRRWHQFGWCGCRPRCPACSAGCGSRRRTSSGPPSSPSTWPAPSGLGVFIQRSRKSYDVDQILVAVVVIAVLTGVLFLIVDALGRLATPWRRAHHHLGDPCVPDPSPSWRPSPCSPRAAAPRASASTTTKLQHVDVVLDWTPNTNHSGLYIAQARGYFARRRARRDDRRAGETSGSQLLAAGKADFAYTVAESLVPARDQGADLVSVATVIEHNTSSLISLRSSGITRPRDLAGHSYGSYGSELEEALIKKLVACDGGDPSAVTFTPLASDDFRIGLTQHQFDTAWVFDAWDTIRLRDVDGAGRHDDPVHRPHRLHPGLVHAADRDLAPAPRRRPGDGARLPRRAARTATATR